MINDKNAQTLLAKLQNLAELWLVLANQTKARADSGYVDPKRAAYHYGASYGLETAAAELARLLETYEAESTGTHPVHSDGKQPLVHNANETATR